MAKYARGTRFVDWKIQGALIGHTLVHWTCFWIASFVMVYGVHVLTGVVIGDPDNSAAPILPTLWDRYKILVISVVSLLPLFCLDLLLWSHRFAGPMIRIRRAVRDLAAGKSAPPIHLRAGDYWTDLAEDINRLQQRLESAEKLAHACQTVMLEDRIDSATADRNAPLSIAVVEA